MPASPNPDEPVLEIIEDLVPAEMHAAAWQVCSGNGWRFGHGSLVGDSSRFWKMDLDGEAAFDAIWEHARPRCEALAGGPLRVVRQYANGHTYGLGGQPHLDDTAAGSFTLLYYPNPEWNSGWEGETFFYDASGEISLTVTPRPNRAVFFDSRIPHAGRAPGRQCAALRVTVAYKLQIAEKPQSEVDCQEIAEKRDGASRVYRVHVREALLEGPIGEHLERLGKTVRLPGFRPGKIPAAMLKQRYGAQVRMEAINRLVAERMPTALPQRSVVSSFAMRAGAESGDLEFEAAVTHIPDLPPVDFSSVSVERLSAGGDDVQAVGLSAADAEALFRGQLKLQVLDRLDEQCAIPLLPFRIESEFAAIWNAAEAQGQLPQDAEQRRHLAGEYRAIAERRLRLGMMVSEIARRNGIVAPGPAELEDRVIDLLLGQARVTERRIARDELLELMNEG